MHMMMMMMMAIRVLREVNTHWKAAVTEQHYKAFVFIFMNKMNNVDALTGRHAINSSH